MGKFDLFYGIVIYLRFKEYENSGKKWLIPHAQDFRPYAEVFYNLVKRRNDNKTSKKILIVTLIWRFRIGNVLFYMAEGH